MSAAEIITEKIKGLSESEAEVVLRCIEGLRGQSPLPSELMMMPPDVRNKIITAQFERAAAEGLYDDPELIMDDREGPLEHD
jgi:hypothetical protein